MEAALLEKSSVVSDPIDIKSNQSESDQANKYSPFSEKNHEEGHLQKKESPSEVIMNIVRQHESALCSQLDLNANTYLKNIIVNLNFLIYSSLAQRI